jgi:hypothetical protein
MVNIKTLPPLIYWKGITEEEYNSLPTDWDFWGSLEEYCNIDVKCLYDVLTKFFEEVQKMNLDPRLVLTASSLAIRLWRLKYMPKGVEIYALTKTSDRLMRQGYQGGRVETLKPLLKEVGYHYDVNSLYPTAMLKPMPIGQPYEIQGNRIPIDLKDFFGFVKCTVYAPYMYFPILCLRTDHLIAPVGVFSGLWFSEELKYALSKGYSILNIEYGIQYEPHDNLFKDYIHDLYEIKRKEKGAKRNIAKLLMNSLYGRFGMHPIDSQSVIANIDTLGNVRVNEYIP